MTAVLHLLTPFTLYGESLKGGQETFCLAPSTSSFWQPKTEMNVALGCPKFASLSLGPQSSQLSQ